MFRTTVAAGFGLCAMLGVAGAQPVLDVGAVPNLTAQARASYAIFLRMNLPRAVAISSGGGIGWLGGSRSLDDARAAALKSCAAKGAGDCAVYAEDLQVVWHGAAPVVLPRVPGPLIQTSRYAFVPDPRYFWHGPQAARGVVVWGHGKGNGNDYRANQPPPAIRAFNNGGFDVVRFGREPGDDYADWAQDWLRQGLKDLRRQGYRFIVSSGQSRGANDALFMLGSAGIVDAVIALSPGSYGVAFSAEFSRSLHQAAAPSARVVFAQFEHDPYAGPDLAGRAELVRRTLQPAVAGLLLIDRPAGFDGHFSGETADFAIKFGDCIYRFAIGQPALCGPAAQIFSR
jgi:hypothetical protein